MNVRKFAARAAKWLRRSAGGTDQPGGAARGNYGLLEAAAGDSADGVLVASPEGAIQWVNQAFVRLTGYPAPEAIGQTARLLECPNRAPEFSVMMWRTIQAGLPWQGEVWIRRKDGSEHLQGTTVTPVRNGGGKIAYFVAILRDTPRPRPREPRAEGELAELGLALSHQGLWDWDLVTGQDYLSPEFARWLGYSRQETGTAFPGGFGLIHTDDLPYATGRLSDHLVGRAAHYEADVRFRRKDGDYLHIRSRGRVTRRDGSGRPSRIAGIHSDISGQARQQEELEQARKMGMLGLMAGGIAHDVNNLLTVVIGHERLLRAQHQLPQQVREELQMIGEAGEHAAALIRPVLSFNRSEAEALAALDLNEVITDFSGVLRSLASVAIELEIRLDPRPGKVKANAGLIQQVILNLVVNARDAMPDGGRLELTTANLRLDTGVSGRDWYLPPGGYVLLTVADTGSGMDETTQNRLFEPLFTTKPPGQGAGLGLSTVQAIVKQLDGGITIGSEPGLGTVARVYLPALEDGEEPEADVTQAAAGDAPPRILIVDGEPAVAEFVNQTLTGAGFRVGIVQSGKEALSILLREPVDLVITDLVMPDMEGLELITKLRRQRPSLAVIAVSGALGGLYLRAALALGVQAALAKPFTASQLLESVREALRLESPNPPAETS